MSAPFTKEVVKKAWKKNWEETDNIYHHPREKDVIDKCIVLSCRKPLTKKHEPEDEPQSCSSEKWLEAYIIQLAKRSNNYKHTFELAGNSYRFLYSQLNFRKMGKNGARPLDCLLYEPATHNLVIVELKATRQQRDKAIKELDYYSVEVLKIKDELGEIFDLDSVRGIKGYVVWPGDDKFRNKTLDFGDWGLIGYSDDKYGMIENGELMEPWKKFKSFGQKLTLKLTKYQDSKVKQ
jgi:hypothetical protein